MKRIILADDHSFIRMGIIQILKDEYPSAEITEVDNGEDLVREVMQYEWDLVISDLDMPGRNGLEALEQIKKIKPSLPVIILSIYTEDLYAVRVIRAGASGYLNKNSAPTELIKAIKRISQGRKYITSDVAEQLLIQNNDKKPHEILLAPTTVSTHRSRIMEKLNLSTNSDLTRYAIAHNIIFDIDL
jgi:two-component system, NarL family, invasion response regulator UvrY